MPIGIFNMLCSLSENGFINASRIWSSFLNVAIGSNVFFSLRDKQFQLHLECTDII